MVSRADCRHSRVSRVWSFKNVGMSDPRSRRRQRAFCGHTPHISQRGDRAGHFLSGILSCSLKLFVVSFWTENATNLWSVNTKNEGSTKKDSFLRPNCSSPKSEIIHTIFCRCCRLKLSGKFSSLRLMTLTTGGYFRRLPQFWHRSTHTFRLANALHVYAGSNWPVIG